MIGARGIAGGGPDPPVGLPDQLFVVEPFVRCIPPELAADALVKVLRERLGEPVRERLEEDARVVVVPRLERGGPLLGSEAGRDRERPHVVRDPALARGDVVGEREVGAALRAHHLLAKGPDDGERCAVLGVRAGREDLDVVRADGAGGEEAEHGSRLEPALGHDPVEHRPGVVVERAGRLADHRVVEDPGKAPGELPRVEERRPVDPRDDVGERVARKHPAAEEAGAGRGVARPVGGEAVRARLRERARPPGALLDLALAPEPAVGAAGLRDERGAALAAHEARRDPRRARRVRDVDHAVLVAGVDLHRGVHLRGGRTPDEQRQAEPEPGHLRRDVHHLVERRGDEAGDPDEVAPLLAGDGEDPFRRHHHPEIDDLEPVALQHHRDDVLADVVHVALRGGEDDAAGPAREAAGARSGAFAGGRLRLEPGGEVRDRPLHHPGGLDHLGEEHPARAEEIADHVHARHQGALDDVEGAGRRAPRFLGVLLDVVRDPRDEGVLDSLLDRPGAPLRRCLLALGAPAARVALRDREEPLAGVRAAVEDHVLDPLPELGLHLVEDGELARVDDGHVEPGPDRVVEERGVHRLAYRVVAAERERDVGEPARDEGAGKALLDEAGRLDEVGRVGAVLLDARRHREDVGVEDDVLGREARFPDEELVRALADRDAPLEGVRLALLVEGHDHHRRPVAAGEAGLLEELRGAVLEADGVDDALALHALEARLDDFPARRVDHHRHPRDVRLRGDEVEEADHARLGVEEPSSMFTSIACAPFSTWLRATPSAVSKSSSRMRRAKRGEPVTLVRSPTLTKRESGAMFRGSRPASRVIGGGAGGTRGAAPATASTRARMWSGVVPQHPPTMLTRPRSAQSPTSRASSSGVRS